jgi:hypothetical protein
MENILIEYKICAAAYYEGKLNGTDCREFIHLCEEIVECIQVFLLTCSHLVRCFDNDIENPVKFTGILLQLLTLSALRYG